MKCRLLRLTYAFKKDAENVVRISQVSKILYNEQQTASALERPTVCSSIGIFQRTERQWQRKVKLNGAITFSRIDTYDM